jgi:RNA polymerase sigma-70 factor, ECF subfamily
MSDDPPTNEVTRLLQKGDLRQLGDLVYEQLRGIATRELNQERAGHTLQATALVNEAYVRLLGHADVPWSSRAHFYGAAVQAMRRILIDHARARGAQKRGGQARRVDLSNVLDLATAGDPAEIVSFDNAISRLEEVDAQAAAIVHLRFYAGLTVQQTALVLGVSDRTVDRGWVFARAWLWRDLEKEQHDGPGASAGDFRGSAGD